MTKQKSTDYKKTVVLYYLNNQVSYTDVCKSLERKTKVNISHKVRKVYLNYVIILLKKNEQITISISFVV